MIYTATFHIADKHGIQNQHVFWREYGPLECRRWMAEVFIPESAEPITVAGIKFPPCLGTTLDAIHAARKKIQPQPTTD